MINEEHAQRLLGRDLLDRDGNRIGEITQVFVNDQTLQPTWVTVTTGWFEVQQSFVPLHQLQWSGEQLRAAYDTATVKAAPRFAADQPLTAQERQALCAHYGLSDPADRLPWQRQPNGEPARPPLISEPRAVSPEFDGRIRRAEAPAAPVVPGSTDPADATVCQRCGAYIAAGMDTVHDTFHGAVTRPPGSYARHDIEVTEPAAGAPRPAGDYARHDVQLTEPADLA